MQSRGPGCFDHRYYLRKNSDLTVLKTVLELWEHFVMLGQFEGRSYRSGALTAFHRDSPWDILWNAPEAARLMFELPEQLSCVSCCYAVQLWCVHCPIDDQSTPFA